MTRNRWLLVGVALAGSIACASEVPIDGASTEEALGPRAAPNACVAASVAAGDSKLCYILYF
jgi:hypothetical protein